MGESKREDKYAHVEPRTNRERFYHDRAAPEAETAAAKALDSRAIYLIEREAIALRRLRWTSAPDPTVLESLAQYQRPSESDEGEDAALFERLRGWLKQGGER